MSSYEYAERLKVLDSKLGWGRALAIRAVIDAGKAIGLDEKHIARDLVKVLNKEEDRAE